MGARGVVVVVAAAVLCLATAVRSLAAAPVTTRFDVGVTPGSNGQSMWDNPRSVKDALASDLAFASSDVIATECGSARFRVEVYPRGMTCARGAAVYLRFLPLVRGDEVDASFSLSLVDGGEVVATSAGCGGAAAGGSPAWRGAMTFCGAEEAVESCGRCGDWGAHAWPAVGGDLAAVRVTGEIKVWAKRRGEASGSLGGALKSVARAAAPGDRAEFSSGEVVVPVATSEAGEAALARAGLSSGGEYRVMAIADVFRGDARDDLELTVRPAIDAFNEDGVDWPVAVSSRQPGVVWRNRFDALAFPARVRRDLAKNPVVGGSPRKALALLFFWVASAVAPVPLVLFARSYASLYVIPSDSMAPTLARGDVLLVDKVGLRRGEAMPDVGDVVVFDQPPALRALVGDSVSKSSQFVKRVVALPGDAATFEPRVPSDAPPLCREPAPALAKALDQAARDRTTPVAPNAVFVRGDCDAVSVDSRIWGDLDRRYLVGRPTYRFWPLSRAGPL